MSILDDFISLPLTDPHVHELGAFHCFSARCYRLGHPRVEIVAKCCTSIVACPDCGAKYRMGQGRGAKVEPVR